MNTQQILELVFGGMATVIGTLALIILRDMKDSVKDMKDNVKELNVKMLYVCEKVAVHEVEIENLKGSSITKGP